MLGDTIPDIPASSRLPLPWNSFSQESPAKNKSKFSRKGSIHVMMTRCVHLFLHFWRLFMVVSHIFLQFLHDLAFHLHPPPRHSTNQLSEWNHGYLHSPRGVPPVRRRPLPKAKVWRAPSWRHQATSTAWMHRKVPGWLVEEGAMEEWIFPSKWRANERFEGSFQVGKRHETESKTSMFCFLFKILWKACQKHMEKHKHYHRRFQGLAAHQKVDPLGIPSCFQNFCLVSFSPNRIHGSGIFSIIFLHLHSFDGCWLFKFQVYNYWRGELLEIGVVSVRFQRNILKFQGACSSKTLIPPCWFRNKPKHVSEACFQTLRKPNYHILWKCWANRSMIIFIHHSRTVCFQQIWIRYVMDTSYCVCIIYT